MTVREAYEKAYGPIPEGYWCGVGSVYYDGEQYIPCVHRGDSIKTWLIGEGWADFSLTVTRRITDNLPSVTFRGLFDELYDSVLPKEESRWARFTDEELEIVSLALLDLNWVHIDDSQPHYRMMKEIQAELDSRKEESVSLDQAMERSKKKYSKAYENLAKGNSFISHAEEESE